MSGFPELRQVCRMRQDDRRAAIRDDGTESITVLVVLDRICRNCGKAGPQATVEGNYVVDAGGIEKNCAVTRRRHLLQAGRERDDAIQQFPVGDLLVRTLVVRVVQEGVGNQVAVVFSSQAYVVTDRSKSIAAVGGIASQLHAKTPPGSFQLKPVPVAGPPGRTTRLFN